MGIASLHPSYDRRDFAISRRSSPEVCIVGALLENRGRREDRVRAAPAVSCATCAEEHAHEHTGSAGAFRPSLRNGFTAYFVLSPVNGSLDTSARLDASDSRHWRPGPSGPLCAKGLNRSRGRALRLATRPTG